MMEDAIFSLFPTWSQVTSCCTPIPIIVYRSFDISTSFLESFCNFLHPTFYITLYSRFSRINLSIGCQVSSSKRMWNQWELLLPGCIPMARVLSSLKKKSFDYTNSKPLNVIITNIESRTSLHCFVISIALSEASWKLVIVAPC